MSTAAAVQTPPSTHNQPPEDAVTAIMLGNVKRAKNIKDAAAKSYKEILKSIESKGRNPKAMEIALKIVEAGETDKYLKIFSEVCENLVVMRRGFNQDQMAFRFESTLEPADERAESDGLAAGRLNFDFEDDNPHDLNTASGQAWLKGYRQGKAERLLILSMPAVDSDDTAAEDDED